MENVLVLKIGGSIIDHPLVLDNFIHVFCANRNLEWKYILLVGGGNKCNQLREQYKSTVLSEEKDTDYHWKSIKFMGDNAKILHSKLAALNENISLSSH